MEISCNIYNNNIIFLYLIFIFNCDFHILLLINDIIRLQLYNNIIYGN